MCSEEEKAKITLINTKIRKIDNRDTEIMYSTSGLGKREK
jgi:hypothetical protein